MPVSVTAAPVTATVPPLPPEPLADSEPLTVALPPDTRTSPPWTAPASAVRVAVMLPPASTVPVSPAVRKMRPPALAVPVAAITPPVLPARA